MIRGQDVKHLAQHSPRESTSDRMLLPAISAATTAAAMTRGLHPAERPAAETTQRGPTHPPRGLSKGPTRESSAPPRDEDCRWAPRARTAPGCAIADRALTRTEIQTPGPSIETGDPRSHVLSGATRPSPPARRGPSRMCCLRRTQCGTGGVCFFTQRDGRCPNASLPLPAQH